MTVKNYSTVRDGRIERHLCVDEDMLSYNLETDETYILGHFHPDTYYVSNGEAILRPLLSDLLPETKNLAQNEQWAIPEVPEMSTVLVDGDVVGVVDGTGLALEFAEVGVWPLEVQPPFPWLKANCEVTVS